MHKNEWKKTIAITLTSAIIGGFFGALITTSLQPNNPTNSEKESITKKTILVEESSVINAVEKASPAVINIVITKDLPLYRQRNLNFDDFFFGNPFGYPDYQRDEKGEIKRTPRKVGGGSGFIVTEDGLTLTNRHVVEDSEADYTAVLSDGRELPVEVISIDSLNDIAVIKVINDDKKSKLPTIKLGESNQLKVGQKVVAIGNALAEYGNSVTTGVISAKNRSITAGSVNKSENLINLLQTDAAINPGNSGGPLINLSGEVIGINVAIANGAQGIGFAIPIDDVKPIIESVKENGRIIRPFIGVRYMLLDEKKANELKIDVKNGALLVGDESEGLFAVIPGSPADKAGLKIKDIITEVDKEKITTETDLRSLIANKKVGDKIKLKVWRSGQVINIDLTLEEAK